MRRPKMSFESSSERAESLPVVLQHSHTLKTIGASLLFISFFLSSLSNSSACTLMMMKDVNGNAYVARLS